MFNVAVINIKKIGKGVTKIIFFVLILCFAIGFANNNSLKNVNINFLPCLDICIQRLKQIEPNNNESLTLSKLILFQIPLTNNVISKTIIQEGNENKQVDEDLYQIEIPQKISTEVIKTNVPESYTDAIEGVNIKNGTDFELTNEMLSKEVNFRNSKKILIYHTHTCESYTPSEKYPYEMTGNYRTTDLNYTVARVGTELTNYLEKSGFTVIHDTTCYDYPSYDESYDRAYNSVYEQINNNPDTEILFDIHRDAIADSSYAPTIKIGEEYAAQLMFVIGSNGAGQDHPNWLNNLNFAVKIQKHANEKYPGLFKPILFRNSRYNQNLGKGACIIEVGATGNTLEQCNTSMKYLADVLRDIL